MIIGALSISKYCEATAKLDPGSRLFVYSDGCYEVWNAEGGMMMIDQFAQVLAEAGSQPGELDRVVSAVQARQQRPDFDDDFSLVKFEL